MGHSARTDVLHFHLTNFLELVHTYNKLYYSYLPSPGASPSPQIPTPAI